MTKAITNLKISRVEPSLQDVNSKVTKIEKDRKYQTHAKI